MKVAVSGGGVGGIGAVTQTSVLYRPGICLNIFLKWIQAQILCNYLLGNVFFSRAENISGGHFVESQFYWRGGHYCELAT